GENCVGLLAASVKDLSAALMTTVASSPCSLGDRAAALLVFVDWAVARVVDFAGARLVVCFVVVVDDAIDSGRRRSRSVTVVAGVHVDAEDIAALTASTFVLTEVIRVF